jgi:Fe-S-cluster-containing hydrogenase component 2
MTYVIGPGCIDVLDRSCLDVCPVECIFEADRMAVIDPYTCIDCGLCQPVCPVGAIFPATGLPPEDHEFLEINAAWADEGQASVNVLVAAYLARRAT